MKKRIRIGVIIAVCTVIGFCLVLGIREYIKNEIAFTVAHTLPDGEGRRARVILLGGQSNASGCSLDAYLQKNVSPEQYAQYESGYDNVYINYWVSGGMNASEGFVPCATRQGEAGGCFGPELGMAERLSELYPDDDFFIIKYAWGGTNLYEQWLSPSSKGKTGRLYREFEAYVKASVKYLESNNYDVVIEGMCWMQGESDSFSLEAASNYGEHLSNLIGDVRQEFARYAPEGGIVFIDAYIADNPVFWVYCDIVNDEKQKVAESSAAHAVIDTNAEGLICTEEPEENPDIPHYDSMSQVKLGHLFAERLSDFWE